MAATPTATSPSSPDASAPPGGSAAEANAGCGALPVGLLASPAIRALALAACVMALLAADQATKVHAIRHWKSTADAPVVLAGGMLHIQYAENPGAFLSLLGGFDPAVRFWLLTVGNSAILGVVAVCLLAGRPRDAWSWWALALIVAGGAGNLIDRARFDSHVIDFLVLTTGPVELPGLGVLRTGIFNVADMAITAGFVMLLVSTFRPTPAQPPAANAEKGS